MTNRYYLTFGDKASYQVVHAPSMHEARLRVFAEYGPRWAFLYREDEKPDAIDRYGLVPLPTELTTIPNPEVPGEDKRSAERVQIEAKAVRRFE